MKRGRRGGLQCQARANLRLGSETDREAMEVSTSGKFSCQQYSWRKRAGSAAAVALAGRRSAEHAPERARSPRPGSMASTREGKPSKESGNERWRSATRAAQPITPAQEGGRDALDVDYQLLRAFSRTARRLTGWRAGEGLMATCTSRTLGSQSYVCVPSIWNLSRSDGLGMKDVLSLLQDMCTLKSPRRGWA